MLHSFKISASLLSADFSILGDEINKLENAGTDYVHIDVMDGVFVPNITIGPCVIKSLRGHTKLPLDVHLMIDDPITKIEDFVDAGADIITVHLESCVHVDRLVNKVKSFNKKVGIAIVPSTPVCCLKHLLPLVDYVLVMSVNPGFGGQKFIPDQVDKIVELKNIIKLNKLSTLISVDGGINAENIFSVVAAGADVVVSGSAIFNAQDININLANLRNAVKVGS